MSIGEEMGPATRRPPEEITVDQGSFKLTQKIHAAVIAIVPAIGTVYALYLAWNYGVTATDITLMLVFYAFTMFGIPPGYHRLFSHRSFKAKTWFKVMLAIAGSMAAQGSVVYWVSNTARHHQYTD